MMLLDDVAFAPSTASRSASTVTQRRGMLPAALCVTSTSVSLRVMGQSGM
jgi:hypothetical protein